MDGRAVSLRRGVRPGDWPRRRARRHGGCRHRRRGSPCCHGGGRSWGRSSLAVRARMMFAFRELVERHKREIADFLTSEHGKVLSDAMGEVPRGQEVVEFACGIAPLLKGEFSENVSTEVDSYSIRQPLGVVAGITPFNFPAMVPMWMFPVAIACGNAFILKPSEKDPSASVLLARAVRRGGAARRRVQRRARRQGGGGRDPRRTPGIAGGELRRLDARRALHLRDRRRAPASACRRSAAPRTTWWCCPTPIWNWRPTPPSSAGYGSTGQRCMAISVVVAVGDVADRLLPQHPRAHRARSRSAPGSNRAPRWARSSRASTATRVAAYLDKGERGRRDARRGRPRRRRSPATRTASSSALPVRPRAARR